ncbi:hypothetical protein [Synechococcus elongatus]|uniref:Uncharacterized protein n=2 Tax=Synechococcus elongatus TaxID=32046 RepID=Q31L72_SYNE7|nr:hypothetical protein [Synechococcus elongatus]ABB58197.1 conserved hypothetical protein [Synechococcus elongatus PCC 7942 = FACHB-805]AJD57328.1 hypothetical protein M744_05515 [Synechococcus elongatus UTEX 2973]MBD2586920.1 hypothetical protein [Synechococcus elongatus FACHB-242]MBD2687991.1 hypothetical protein [Synechococcus elongatus FACHB-1061]MBD2706298.1 hypothetical protein [Synechococcus elongatus PCC 7942 = FACHB-805]
MIFSLHKLGSAIAPVTAIAIGLTGLTLPAQAYPAWTTQDDYEFVRSFTASFQAQMGYAPSDSLVAWSLNCVKTNYTQSVVSGINPSTAVNTAIANCGRALQTVVGNGNGGTGRGSTIYNSSGDSSLSSDSNGCLYFSSGSFSNSTSYSTC